MLKRIQNFLFPLELRERRNAFVKSQKNKESTYSYQDIFYRVTKNQSWYSTLFSITPYLPIPIIIIIEVIFPRYQTISRVLDMIITLVLTLLIAKVGLYLFIDESNKNIIS